MTWSTIDRAKITDEVRSLDRQIVAITGHHPENSAPFKTKDLSKAIVFARLMGTRDALVIVANCLNGGGNVEGGE